MKTMIAALIITGLITLTSIADAHDGHHFAGVAGTANNTDTTAAWMMMPHKPTRISKHSHVIGWTVLWDWGATGQYAEAGIGYKKAKSKNAVILWWASERHGYVNKIGSVPFGVWVDVNLRKLPGEEYVVATWTWSGGQIEKRIKVPGWYSDTGYHPTQGEVWVDDGKRHPRDVELHFNYVTTFPGDRLRWHIDGPWQPYGTFDTFTVKQ